MSYIAEEAKRVHPYKTDTSIDYLAWAKQIIYREKRKDDTLLSIQVRFAKEALGISA